jgi:hypothetical protein
MPIVIPTIPRQTAVQKLKADAFMVSPCLQLVWSNELIYGDADVSLTILVRIYHFLKKGNSLALSIETQSAQ